MAKDSRLARKQVPRLTAELVDTFCNRLESNWVLPGQGPLDISIKQMGAVLFTLFPRYYDGDPHEATSEAARLFPQRLLPKPSQKLLSKRMERPCVTWIDIPYDDECEQ